MAIKIQDWKLCLNSSQNRQQMSRLYKERTQIEGANMAVNL